MTTRDPGTINYDPFGDPYPNYDDFGDEINSQEGIIDSNRSTDQSYHGYDEIVLPPVEAATTSQSQSASATWKSGSEPDDWRVRLSLPLIESFQNSPLLAPLVKSNNALVFPYTPTIIMAQSANYNALSPVHSNYPFYSYQNSSIEPITINGDFYVETARDAAYWVGAVQYLRSVTKMFYGESSNLGNPPPVVKLNGYGDFVFNNIPVVITNFTVELLGDVDYISVESGGVGSSGSGKSVTHVPTQSVISVTCQPIYSRKEVSKFSLDDFVKGDYVLNGKGFI